MRPKSLILLALALGCGLVASIGISQVLDGNKHAAVETVPIYVALENINVGDPVTDATVSLEEWPKDRVPVGAIAKWEDLEDRRPRSNIYKGEPILDTKLLTKGQTNDPIQGVPTGMRLKTISVDARKSAAGLLGPGDRVDVQIYVQRNEREGINNPFTKIFLQNIRVYAVDQTIDKSSDGEDARNVAKTVSLIVTPAQANRITLAENMGEVSLIPRNPDDELVIDDSEQGADDLLGRSTANSRKKEQQSEDDEETLGGLKSLVSRAVAGAAAAQAAATAQAPATPPFQMTIIFPTEVSKVQFSATGEPLEPTTTSTAGGAPPEAFTAPTATPAPTPAPAGSDEGASPDEKGETGDTSPAGFPIDLRLK